MQPPGDISCGEIGTPDAERWSDPVHLSPAERDAVEALGLSGVLETRPAPRGVQVAGVDQVGTVCLPGGRRVCVRPKVGNLVLLDWLAYVGDTPPVSDWARQGDLGPSGNVPSVLGTMLLRELDALSRRPLPRAFAEVRQESAVVRGRVLAGALGRSAHRLPAIPQACRVRTADTPHNRLLASALDRLGGLLDVTDADVRQTWSRLRDEWSVVSRDTSHPARLVADARCACPAGYEGAVQLAGAVLQGCTGSPVPAAAGGTFLISLSNVWERALRRMCAGVRDVTGWVPVADAHRTRRWHDGAGAASPVRWMTADVLLASGGRRWVLDAKYKRDFGREDRNDRFQATAYALAFDARRGTLVYPTADGESARNRLLLAGHVSKDRVTIDSIELPMSAGPDVCRQALAQVMKRGEPVPREEPRRREPTLFDDL